MKGSSGERAHPGPPARRAPAAERWAECPRLGKAPLLPRRRPRRTPFQLSRGRGQRRRAGRGEWSRRGRGLRCPPRSRAGSASGGRAGVVQAPPSGLRFGKKRRCLRQEKSERGPLPLRRARAAAAAAHLTRGHPGRRGPRKLRPGSAHAAHWRGREPAHPDPALPSAGRARSPSCPGHGAWPPEPRRRPPEPPRPSRARAAGRASKRGPRPSAPTPPARRPHRRRYFTAVRSPQVAAGWRGAAMVRGVRVLLLLGLLHWAGGGEGRKTWRRRGQQPPPQPSPQRAEAAPAAGQPVESFPLDFTAVEGNMDSFMAQVKSLAQSLYPCSAQQLNEELRLHLLLNTSVTCNDGSPAGYYLKESKGSRRWLLFLEGGWYCFNRENCDSRYATMRRLMSSSDWPRTRTGTGILSSQPEENPHWWNANMVFIPYCSSDVWSGASPKSEKNGYAFMGTLIVQEVVRELLDKGLGGAKVLLLAGSSAGGTGVLLNVDRVAEQLQELGYPAIQVRGLADSGWFLDNKQYRRTGCVDTVTCAPTEAIRRGIRYWNGVVPERCRRQFKEGEEWNCFFGYKIYPTLRCPVFVVQWLFDEAQLTVGNVHLTGQPVQEGQWLYIQNVGRELRHTLQDVSASFAPACLSHEIILHSHWTDVQVKGTSLPRALHCWDRSLHDSHKAGKAPLKGCPVHLVDGCSWPHCNPSCPTIRDQFTGQEMSAAQFLLHLGFDVHTAAQQQGLEPSRLLGMLSSGS